MATFNKFYDFTEQLGLETHNLSTDVIKVYLSDEQPLAADTVKGDVAEIAATNLVITPSAVGDISAGWSDAGSGVATMTGTDTVFTATGGAVAQFQFVVMFNETSGSDNLIGWYDYGSAVNLADGETFTVNFGASILTIT